MMDIKEFEKEVSVANEQDILVTVLVCVKELLQRQMKERNERQDGTESDRGGNTAKVV